MKLVYIAAPYTASTVQRRNLNVEVAKHMGCLVAELGLSPLMPTVNSSGFDELARQLSACDAIVFCQGWHKSSGCIAEMEQAKAMGIPIFLDVRALEEWYKDELHR